MDKFILAADDAKYRMERYEWKRYRRGEITYEEYVKERTLWENRYRRTVDEQMRRRMEDSKMKTDEIYLVFICGPYRGESHNEVHQNIERARNVATLLWKLGYAVICPHLNSAFFSGACNEENFTSGYLKILSICDIVVMVGDWQKSEGASKEHALAVKLGKRIMYHTL